jgi:23S rRNA (uracil1939-C5)-methyltransferase
VFVPWTAPGDRVRVRINENKKTFLIAALEEILEPSPVRIEPSCPVFGRCGGCTWQHVSYAEQVRQKDQILRSALRNYRSSFDWEEFVSSPDFFRYRNRIQVNKGGESVGFFARGTREIVDINDCPITESEISSRISEIRERENGRYEISRRVNGHIEIEQGHRSSEAALFSQVNTKQNSALIETVLRWAAEKDVAEIWDLYCGSGNITLPLKKAFPHVDVTGVELSADAIRLAQKDSADVHWVAKDVAHFLKQQRQSEKSLLMVLDPPRVGAEEAVVAQIGRLKPNRLIYVSCNPMTFGRDALRLKDLGLTLIRVQGFDMFPQTEHVELIGLFHRVMGRE